MPDAVTSRKRGITIGDFPPRAGFQAGL
jgi:hypothetical protein